MSRISFEVWVSFQELLRIRFSFCSRSWRVVAVVVRYETSECINTQRKKECWTEKACMRYVFSLLSSQARLHLHTFHGVLLAKAKSMPHMEVISTFIPRPSPPRHPFSGVLEKSLGHNTHLPLKRQSSCLLQGQSQDHFSLTLCHNSSHLEDPGENLMLWFAHCLMNWTWNLKHISVSKSLVLPPKPGSMPFTLGGLSSWLGVQRNNELGTDQVHTFSQHKLPLCVQWAPHGPQRFAIWLHSLKRGRKVK